MLPFQSFPVCLVRSFVRGEALTDVLEAAFRVRDLFLFAQAEKAEKDEWLGLLDM